MKLYVQSVTCPQGADSATVKLKRTPEIKRREALKMSIEVQIKVLESRMIEFNSKAKNVISCIELTLPGLNEDAFIRLSEKRAEALFLGKGRGLTFFLLLAKALVAAANRCVPSSVFLCNCDACLLSCFVAGSLLMQYPAAA